MHYRFIHRILVCEFITGGGLNHVDLPQSLVLEGRLMRDALLHDLAYLPYQIVTTVDSRLTAPANVHQVQMVHPKDDVWQLWQTIMHTVDAVWLIAPETDGALERLTTLAEKMGKTIIGSAALAVALTANKWTTFLHLQAHHIKTIPTFTVDTLPMPMEADWVVKPVDGAGCERTYRVSNLPAWLQQCQSEDRKRLIFQPYQAGQAASIACVMQAGHAEVLSCNLQLIDLQQDRFEYQGSIVNGLAHYWPAFTQLAKQVAQALPALNGYVGIDVIVPESDASPLEPVVVEINPRLTTSYVGLARAMEANPAALIMQYLSLDAPTMSQFKRHVIHINKLTA